MAADLVQFDIDERAKLSVFFRKKEAEELADAAVQGSDSGRRCSFEQAADWKAAALFVESGKYKIEEVVEAAKAFDDLACRLDDGLRHTGLVDDEEPAPGSQP